MELCIGLVLLIVAALVILGIWHVVRLIGENSSPKVIVRRPCRNCQYEMVETDSACPNCLLPVRLAALSDELRGTAECLKWFRKQELLDDETLQRLTESIERRQNAIVRKHNPVAKAATTIRPPHLAVSPPVSEAILEVLPVEAPPPLVRKMPVARIAPSTAPTEIREAATAAVAVAPKPPIWSASVVPELEPRRRRSLTEWLAAFMEQRNILWGEIIGGLLMVGCTVALVLSLWRTLDHIPLFPFLVLSALTGLLFFVGRYTLHHWKLEATSRGLLTIALLLVPLNFLVLAGLSPRSSGNLVEIAIKIIGVGVFAPLVWFATRDLFPQVGSRISDARLLAVSIWAVSLAPLALPRVLATGADAAWLFLLLPITGYGVMTLVALHSRWRRDDIAPWQFLGWLGLASFPLVLTLGFAGLWWTRQGGALVELLPGLAPLLAAAVAPAIICGLFVQRRCGVSAIAGVAGTVVALIGLMFQAAALIAAWPDPRILLIVGLLIAALWTTVAFLLRTPLANAIALPGIAAVHMALYALVVHGVHAELAWHALVEGGNGLALAATATLLIVVADQLRRLQLWPHGMFHAAGAAIFAVIGLALTVPDVIQLPWRFVVVGTTIMAAAFVIAWRWQWRWLTQSAWCVLPLVTTALFHWIVPRQFVVWWAPALALEAILLNFVLPKRSIPMPWTIAVAACAALLAGPWASPPITVFLLLAFAAFIVPALRWDSEIPAGIIAAVIVLLLSGITVVDSPQRFVLAGIAVMAGAFTVARRWRSPMLAQGGWAILPLVTTAALHWLAGDYREWWALVLGIEALALGIWMPKRNVALPAAVVAACGIALWANLLTQPTVTLLIALLVATAYVQAYRWRSAELAWVSSALLFGLLAQVFVVRYPDWLPLPWAAVALVHATLLTSAAIWEGRIWPTPLRSALAMTARISSVLALPLLTPNYAPDQWLAIGIAIAWVAALWLLWAWRERSSVVFAGGQIAVTGAIVFFVGAAVRFVHGPQFDRLIAMDAFGVGLALSCIGWTLLRWRFRGHVVFRAAGPPVETLLLGGLITGALAGMSLLAGPAIGAELMPTGSTISPAINFFQALPGGPWRFVVALAAALVLQARGVRRIDVLFVTGLQAFALALAVLLLASQQFGEQVAAASVLRWGLVLLFVALAPLLWCRDWLLILLERLGVRREGALNFSASQIFRWLAFVICAMIPIVLTAITVGRFIDGERLAGPLPGTFFHRLGFSVSHGVPLVLIAVVLTGYALREREAWYHFAGQVLFAAAVAGGIALHVTRQHRPLDLAVADTVLISAVLASALWAVAGSLISRLVRPFNAILEYLNCSVGLEFTGPVAWCLVALPATLYAAVCIVPTFEIIVWPNAPIKLPFDSWHVIALAGSAIAGLLILRRERGVPKNLALGAFGLSVGITAAATAAQWIQGQWFAYHVLTVGWALAAVVTYWMNGDHRRIAQLLFGTLVLGLSLRGILAPAAVPQAAAFAVIVLAGVFAVSVRRRDSVDGVLLLFVWGAIEMAWSFVPVEAHGLWLHRCAAVVLVLTLAGVAYGNGRAIRSRWSLRAQWLGPRLGLAAAAALLALFALEGVSFDPLTRRTPLTYAETGGVLACMTVMLITLLRWAVLPQRDPFALSESRRTIYVYAGEVLLVLGFLHLRLNVPGLFPPVPAKAWPFVVMALAFAGVGLSELFRKWRLDVLSRPLRRTGIFLPLLPLLMFWLKPPAAMREALVEVLPGSIPLLNYVEQMNNSYGAYAALWLLVGALYAWLAIGHRSFWYALVAALAANAGLWALWQHTGVSILLHPQLWLVPLGVIVLAAEWYQRSALRPEVAGGLRYLGLGLLYLSSTADLFITGLGNSVALPLALAVLSVLGVLVGVLLRVRSYLFLGTGFLGLVVFSMIWHAAVDRQQTWLWWACGIVLGAAILALFALFEKRRQGVLRVVDDLRHWE